MNNPFESPASIPAAILRRRSISVSFVVLAVNLFLTESFALLNAIGEAVPNVAFIVFVTLISGVSQLPGLLIVHWRWKTRSAAAIPMEFGAYVIAATGCAMYVAYALHGPTNSPNTAAHVHVIFFPYLHCIFAIGIYLACGVVAGIINMISILRARGNPLAPPVSANEPDLDQPSCGDSEAP